MESKWNPFLNELEDRLQKELWEVLKQEELLWFQKSRTKWIQDGDHNTSFYHPKTIIKRRKTRMAMLRNKNEDQVDNKEELVDLVINFHKGLFSRDLDPHVPLLINLSFPIIHEANKVRINKLVIVSKARRVIFDMGASKASSEDSFLAIFYQANWDMMGIDLYKFNQSIHGSRRNCKT